jgi:hypothetical protein
VFRFKYLLTYLFVYLYSVTALNIKKFIIIFSCLLSILFNNVVIFTRVCQSVGSQIIRDNINEKILTTFYTGKSKTEVWNRFQYFRQSGLLYCWRLARTYILSEVFTILKTYLLVCCLALLYQLHNLLMPRGINPVPFTERSQSEASNSVTLKTKYFKLAWM